jgi:hypothetical protein
MAVFSRGGEDIPFPGINPSRFGIACMDTNLIIGAGIVAAALFALIMSRIGDRYGKIRPSRDATEAYENFRVNPQFRYYISGSDAYPGAIIGIDKAWTLESDLWKKRDLDTWELKDLVRQMQSRGAESSTMLHGFAIHDNRGRIIGDRFSLPDLHMPVRIVGAYRVVVDTPPLEPFGRS